MSRARKNAKKALAKIRDYVKIAAPEPEVLRVIGENSKLSGTDKITLREINRIIREVRKRHKRAADLRG